VAGYQPMANAEMWRDYIIARGGIGNTGTVFSLHLFSNHINYLII
jgi:hypothetical protein